jgi:hypothetical protein
MIWLLIGYMWLYIHRPFEIWPVLATIQIERIYVIVAIIATLFASQGMVRSSLTRALLIFAGAVLLCWMASPWRDTVVAGTLVSNWFKVLVFYFLVILNVRTERDLQWLVLGFVGVISLFMLHSIWEFHHGRRTVRMGIARMNGINVYFGHPNTFGTTLVCALPFYGLIHQLASSRWMRFGAVAGILGVLYCIVSTGSRSCMVGVVAAAALVAMRTRQRGKLILATVVLIPIIWSVIPSDKQTRFLTVFSDSYYDEQSRSAQVSAETRTEGFYEGWQLFHKYPLTGSGPGAWIPATGWSIESHNLYGQLPGEMGLVGLGAFGLLLGAYWRNLRSMRQLVDATHPSSEFLHRLTLAIGDATLLLLLLGMAGHNLFRFNWVWHAAFLAVGVHVAAEQYALTETSLDDTESDEDEDEHEEWADDQEWADEQDEFFGDVGHVEIHEEHPAEPDPAKPGQKGPQR